MAVRVSYTLLLILGVWLYLAQEVEALNSPTGVRATTVNGTDFLIISWDYQSNANFFTVAVKTRTFKPTSNLTDTTFIHPFKPYCSVDNTTCSYCVANILPISHDCQDVDSEYKFFVGIELYHEKQVEVRVGACSENNTNNCLDSGWVKFTTPAGAPSGVRDVHARPLSSKTVYVSWTVPSNTRGTIQSYTVYYKPSTGQEKSQTFSDAGTNGTLVGLIAGTTYDIWVTASTSVEEGERSNVTSVETYEDECVSSPCFHDGSCELSGDSFKCDCLKAWEGTLCDVPKGYSRDKSMCLDGKNQIETLKSFSNVSLSYCTAQCNDESSCKSFIYGTVETDSSFPMCFLQTATRLGYTLKTCGYDYYEKGGPLTAGTTALLPTGFLLGVAVWTRFVAGQ